MDKLELAAVLNRAADYLDAYGVRSGSWGAPGGPVCMNSALAIALDREPRALGRMWFFDRSTNQTTNEVGRVILESGLLGSCRCPRVRPAGPGGRGRRKMDVRRAVLELAAWCDVPGGTAGFAAAAIRAQAVALIRGALPGVRPAAAAVAGARELVPA